jgi:hypothetical protein
MSNQSLPRRPHCRNGPRLTDGSPGPRGDRDDRTLAIAAGKAALVDQLAAVRNPQPPSKTDRRHEALAQAYGIELERFTEALARRLPKIAPAFDLSLLSLDDPDNREWWKLFCGLTRHLDDGRKVPVEAIARIVAALFFTTLLARHGISPPGFDLDGWSRLKGGARRKQFMWLWLWLYCRTMPRDNRNSAPTRRASYEVAKMLLPGAARDWERDRVAMAHFDARVLRRFAAGNPTLKAH